MFFDISELPESKYAFSRKNVCVYVYMRARVCVCVCNKFVRSITRNWPEVSSLSLSGT